MKDFFYNSNDTVKNRNGVGLFFKLLCLALIIVILSIAVISCSKPEPIYTDEQKIEMRIEEFLTSYNDGDWDATLACLDAETRNKFQAIMNIANGLLGGLSGYNLDLSDVFTLGVGLAEGDFLEVELYEIHIISETRAIAVGKMNLYGDEPTQIYFKMLYENDGWYIQDMTDNNPGLNLDESGNVDSGHMVHNYVKTEIAATCKEPGYTLYKCSECDAFFKEGYKSQLDHIWSEWKNDGSNTIRECTQGCGETQSIVAIEATYNGGFHILGENVTIDGFEVYAVLSDESVVQITSNITLSNTEIKNIGNNDVTVNLNSISTSASVVGICDNLPNTTDINDFEWNYDSDGYTLLSYNGDETSVVIPAHIDKVPVRTIARDAFSNNSDIEEVIIPTNIETIEMRAFSCCYYLEKLTLNEGLKIIWDGAFENCAITSVVIPNSVTEFKNWSDWGVFNNCTELKNVVIGDKLKVISANSFAHCTSLENVTIGANVETISRGAFYSCESLSRMDFTQRLEIIEEEAFRSCSSLVSVNIPSSVEEIGIHAFADCTSLINLTLNEGLKIIWDGAFENCAITSVAIPNSVTEFKSWSDWGVFNNCTELKNVLIGDKLKVISANSFAHCTSLENVTIGANVETISRGAFYSCESLSRMDFTQRLEIIEEEAFRSCSSLVSVNIPSSVEEIGIHAFADCTSLINLTLNEGLKIIWDGAFENCAITSVVIPNSVTEFKSWSDWGVFNNCTELKNVVIGDKLKVISANSFAHCTSLESVTFGSRLEEISYNAFYECTSLKKINIPTSVKEIGYNAFYGCPCEDYITYS